MSRTCRVWGITRQAYWGVDPEEGQYTVEICRYGFDHAGSDGLVALTEHEWRDFTDPREAVRAAFRVMRAWRRARPDIAQYITVAMGYTVGGSCPLLPDEPGEPVNWKSLMARAQAEWETLPKCDGCGGLLPEEYYYHTDFGEDFGRFCREYCLDWEVAKSEKIWAESGELVAA